MPQPNPVKKLRKLEEFRVEPRKASHGAPHGGESWAVSYADMLMVLLSFFVMFFSLKEENPDTFDAQLSKISLSMKGLQSPKDGAKDGASDAKVPEHAPASLAEMKPAGAGAVDVAKAAGVAPNEPAAAGLKPEAVKNPANLAEALNIKGVTVTDERTQLVVTLDEGAFGAAKYTPQGELLNEIDQIVDRLKPFQTQIQIQIIGHTDALRLRPRNEFLQDNFDLSSIRALHVLKRVISKGFPENRASARAASSYDRVARSVTFVIQPLGEPKPEKGS